MKNLLESVRRSFQSADFFLMRRFAKIMNNIERLTGITPLFFSALIALLHWAVIMILMIPTIHELSNFIWKHFGEGYNKHSLFIVGTVHLYYILYGYYTIFRRAMWRRHLFMSGELYVMPGTNVVPDLDRPWWLIHMSIVPLTLIYINYQYAGPILLFAPTFFMWPSLALCGVAPHYKPDRPEQQQRRNRAFVSFVLVASTILTMINFVLLPGGILMKGLVAFFISTTGAIIVFAYQKSQGRSRPR